MYSYSKFTVLFVTSLFFMAWPAFETINKLIKISLFVLAFLYHLFFNISFGLLMGYSRFKSRIDPSLVFCHLHAMKSSH